MADNDFIEKILNDTSIANRESFVSITKYISTYHLTGENAYLFLKIISGNIPEALDALFKNKNPESFFSTLGVNRKIILGALDILVKHKPKELEEKALLASLGILQTAYKNGREGFSIYKLSFSDIHHTAKHLVKNNKRCNDMIIDILESIWNYDNKNEVGVLAINILNTFYDKKKKLSDFIPETLLL
jgi:hypothetical protein